MRPSTHLGKEGLVSSSPAMGQGSRTVSSKSKSKSRVSLKSKKGKQLSAHIEKQSQSSKGDLLSTIEELKISNQTLKAVNDELREREARYRRVTDAAPVLIWESGRDANCTFFNQPWLEFTGRSFTEELENGWTKSVHLEDVHRCKEIYRKSFASRTPFQIEYRLRRADGQYRWILNNGAPSFDESGSFSGFISTCIDITDRKQAEEALALSKEHYRLLVETTRTVPWEADTEFQCFSYIGPQALHVFGYPLENWYQPGFRASCIHPEDRERVLKYSRDKIAQHQDFENEYRIIGANGRNVYVKNLVTLVRSNGTIRSLRGHFMDITQSKVMEQEKVQLERQLRHSQRMEALGVLAGGIAHDFNNLLTAIVGFSTVGLRKLPPQSPLIPNLKGILTAGARARELVRQILLFGKREEGVIRLVDVARVADEVIAMLRASIPSTIEIHKSVDISKAKMMADPSHIHQLMMNLCTNSYQAIGNKTGSIEIRIEHAIYNSAVEIGGITLKAGDYIKLQVKDSGCGMDIDTLNRIFEPFYTTKDSEGGSGMGLSVVHGIVSQYGGAVSVDSSPDAGTAFSIYFPRYLEEGELADSKEKQVRRGTGNILFVDDENMLADLGREILSDLGYTVTTFTDCSEALAEFQSNPQKYDLIITDLTMPKMTGIQFTKLIKEVRSDIPVILATGYMRDVTPEMLSQTGIGTLLSKPYTLEEIGHVIWDALHPEQTH